MIGLKVQPELRRRSKGMSKEPRSFSGHASFAADELVDTLHRNTQVRRKSDLGQSQRLEIFFEEDNSGMSWNA